MHLFEGHVAQVVGDPLAGLAAEAGEAAGGTDLLHQVLHTVIYFIIYIYIYFISVS